MNRISLRMGKKTVPSEMKIESAGYVFQAELRIWHSLSEVVKSRPMDMFYYLACRNDQNIIAISAR